MASATGTSNACTDLSDSPTRERSREDILPSVSSTASALAACPCSLASAAPLAHSLASSSSTYSSPSREIEPRTIARVPSR